MPKKNDHREGATLLALVFTRTSAAPLFVFARGEELSRPTRPPLVHVCCAESGCCRVRQIRPASQYVQPAFECVANEDAPSRRSQNHYAKHGLRSCTQLQHRA